jgi:hypothetical protein
VTFVIRRSVHVDFDDADGRLIDVVSDPVGADENVWMCVPCHEPNLLLFSWEAFIIGKGKAVNPIENTVIS